MKSCGEGLPVFGSRACRCRMAAPTLARVDGLFGDLARAVTGRLATSIDGCGSIP
jgi:hypothetical protein